MRCERERAKLAKLRSAGEIIGANGVEREKGALNLEKPPIQWLRLLNGFEGSLMDPRAHLQLFESGLDKGTERQISWA